jgi:hypothetical protein
VCLIEMCGSGSDTGGGTENGATRKAFLGGEPGPENKLPGVELTYESEAL